ncbi:hypothetical protein HQ560_09920, partial [bacterium]|nr:hypothetical protein [bacterium]
MWRSVCVMAVALGLATAFVGIPVFAAAPAEIDVQGMYKGAWKSAEGEGALTARVVALGNKEYMVLAEWPEKDGKIAKSELKGKLESATGVFKKKDGESWEVTYAPGKVTGKNAKGETVALDRFIPKSPSFDKKPPAGATILIDGKNFDNMGFRPPKKGKPQTAKWET